MRSPGHLCACPEGRGVQARASPSLAGIVSGGQRPACWHPGRELESLGIWRLLTSPSSWWLGLVFRVSLKSDVRGGVGAYVAFPSVQFWLVGVTPERALR